MTIACIANTAVQHWCVFKMPCAKKAKIFTPKTQYDGGRIKMTKRSKEDPKICEILVDKVKSKDLGAWRCLVRSKSREYRKYKSKGFNVTLTDPTYESAYEPTPEPSYEPSPEPTYESTPEPTYEPTPEPTYKPAYKTTTSEHTYKPTPEPSPEPTYKHTPEPSYETTPEPTPEPSPEPTYKPTPESTYASYEQEIEEAKNLAKNLADTLAELRKQLKLKEQKGATHKDNL